MLRHFLPLTIAATLLTPLAILAAPTTPAPGAPTAAPAKNANHVNGKITAIDLASKTLTVTQHKVDTKLTWDDSTKIYKISDAKKKPTGTAADLTVNATISSTTNGDATTPVAKEIHLRAAKIKTPKTKGGAAPVAPTTPAAP